MSPLQYAIEQTVVACCLSITGTIKGIRLILGTR